MNPVDRLSANLLELERACAARGQELNEARDRFIKALAWRRQAEGVLELLVEFLECFPELRPISPEVADEYRRRRQAALNAIDQLPKGRP